MEEEHQDLDKPINKATRFTCYYSLRENPKKKTQKSPEPMKKILFECEECGKGFRYEKCFTNHRALVHLSTKNNQKKVFEESISFSLVRKKKRSKLIRYKRTSLSCSFTFLDSSSVFPANGDELEVAECLILLSKSSPKCLDGLKLVAEDVDVNVETPKSSCLRDKKVSKGDEFEDGFSSHGTSKDSASFLGGDNKLDQQKLRKGEEFESGFLSNGQRMVKEEVTTPVTSKEHKFVLDQGGEFSTGFLSNEQKLMKGTWKEPASNELVKEMLQKAGDFELGVGATKCYDSDTEMVTESDTKNVEHQCRLCNKIFSSYQALGGHQTFHRVTNKRKNKKDCREESVDSEDESEKNTHKCNFCSRSFGSVHALGGHTKSHNKRHHPKTEDDEVLGVS